MIMSRSLKAILALTVVLTPGCTVLNGIPTDNHRQLPPMGDSANNGAGMSASVAASNHHSDSVPDKATERTGSGTETGH